MKVIADRTKPVIFATVSSLALLSQAFAVLRPPFPIKAAPPFEGEIIIVEDDLTSEFARTTGQPEPCVTACARIERRGLLLNEPTFVGDASANIWQR